MGQRKKRGWKKEEGGVVLEGAKWVKHYSSNHRILLVGEGDFSFSLSLARSFGSASNIVASSLDSYDDVTKKYKNAKSNLNDVQKLGACLLHGVDATKMKLHSNFKKWRFDKFDRIIFNFPHAGFHGKEDELLMIKMHQGLVLGFFKNARCMLRANGEIHVNHKTTAPFSHWNLGKLALQSFLTLMECADFKKEDYPGYNNKRGDGRRCDEPFPLGRCCTFKFRAMGKDERRKCMGSMQQRNLPLQEIQFNVEQLPTLVDNYYPQTSHISKLNESVTSVTGLRNGYTPISDCYLNNVAEIHGRAASAFGYFSHGVNLGSHISLQPMQPLHSLQPWPTSTLVRYPQPDPFRTMDMASLSPGARNEAYQFFGGSSNYWEEAHWRTAQSAGYSYQRVRPEFERHNAVLPGRTLNHDIYVQHRPMSSVASENGRMFVGP